MKRLAASLGGMLWLCTACADSAPQPSLQSGKYMQFRNEVYPVLLRDCGFAACHGARERFFRVWGPGRVRLPRATAPLGAFDQPTGHEAATSYSLALSMIDAVHPERSPLLRKPLAVEAGGSGHFGVDKYGRDVYRTTQDSGYITIARWVFAPSEQASP